MSMKHDGRSIDDATVRKIADLAEVDPRSVLRRLVGLPVRGRTGVRVDRCIAKVLGEAHVQGAR